MSLLAPQAAPLLPLRRGHYLGQRGSGARPLARPLPRVATAARGDRTSLPCDHANRRFAHAHAHARAPCHNLAPSAARRRARAPSLSRPAHPRAATSRSRRAVHACPASRRRRHPCACARTLSPPARPPSGSALTPSCGAHAPPARAVEREEASSAVNVYSRKVGPISRSCQPSESRNFGRHTGSKVHLHAGEPDLNPETCCPKDAKSRCLDRAASST